MTGPYTNARRVHPGLDVTLPSGATITSTHLATLDLPALPLAARQCHLFPDLTSGSLISVGQLCDHGCTAKFTADSVDITHCDSTVLHGTRTPATGLWHVNSPSVCVQPVVPPPAMLLSAHATSVAAHVAFYHAAMCSPSLSTWCAAIDAGFLTTWPALTSAQVRRHPPFSVPMLQGHLDHQRSNLRSTQPALPIVGPESPLTPVPPLLVDGPAPVRTHNIFVDCQQLTGQIASDLPGRFLVSSSRGHSYVLLVYDFDSNYIHAEPLRSRSGPDILTGYKASIALLTSRGLTPQLQRLDNEASQALQQYLTEQAIDYQLAPPHVHRRNSAERAIRTFKNHFIATLSGTDPEFPLHLWDRLLPQVLLTLNLLRASRINPRLSAQAQIHGAFDFNRTPLAPPGTRVMIHETSSVRGTWAPHAVDGWYLGPALHHYRCYTVYVKETQHERIADTLVWFPRHVTFPVQSSADAATTAAHALTHALLHPSPASPLSPISDYQRSALIQLADIFAMVARPAALHPPPGFAALPAPAPIPPRVAFHLPPVAPMPALTLPLPAGAAPIPSQLAAPPLVPPPTLPRVPSPISVNDPALAPATYTDVTGNAGRRRRQRAKLRRNAAPPSAQPLPVTPTTTDAPHSNTRNRASRRGVVAPAAGAHFAALCSAFGSHSTTSSPVPGAPQCLVPIECHDPPPHSANAVLDPNTGAALSYRQLREGPDGADWLQSAANEIGRLAQGVLPHMPTGTDTIHFIQHTALPAGRKATYLRIVAEVRPLKAETKRVRFTVGGNQIDFPGKVSTPTADLTTVKLLINSVLSTPNAQFATADISNFYLNNPMQRFEYMRIPVSDIPPSIMAQYHLLPLVHKGTVLVEIRKGMYGLPQAGIIANTRLIKHLAAYGYVPVAHTAGLFKHLSRPVTFCLTVDDFGIKYIDRCNADHLFKALRDIYAITTDWSGTKYCGLTLAWDYDKRTCDVSMPGYIAKALHRFQHEPPLRPQHSPHAWQAPQYGSSTQLTAPADTSALLDAAGITRLQEIIGVLLYYARAVDNTLLVALGTLASAPRSEATATAIVQLLNYCATHPDAVIRFCASDMVLHVHSDASYLSEAHARSRAGGYFFLSDRPPHLSAAPLPNSCPPPVNGPVHVPSSIMRVVLSSATEAEMGALFYNAKDAAWLRTTLEDLGHPQPPTPIQTDNACAAGIINDTVKQRRSKAIDMRFYWVRDRVRQNQFIVHWRKGTDNLADYFTKHHSPSHHRLMRDHYLHPATPATSVPIATAPPSHAAHLVDCHFPQCNQLPSISDHSILGEGVLRNQTATYGFPYIMTQNDVTPITLASSPAPAPLAGPLIIV
jgi:hypothetical protein